MKKLTLSVAAFGALLAGSASAADMRMPVKAAPMPVVAVYNWTGCYVGAGGGYGMFNQDITERPGPTLNMTVGGRGWFGTVQGGCDYQISSNIVIGAFADFDWSGLKGDFNPPTASQVGEEKQDWSWAVGGRIGWLPFQAQQLLVYVSGGYTQTRFDAVSLVSNVGGVPAPASLAAHTYKGWFVGTGYEYGLSFLPGLFWKTEYRFAQFNNANVPVIFNGAPNGSSYGAEKYIHTVRSELVWRFNVGGAAPVTAPAPAPVVAAYNWTGCYVGAGGGYGMFNQDVSEIPTNTLNMTVGGRGWFGTVQGGCDYQVASNIVAGAFGDFDWSGLKGDFNRPTASVVGEEKQDWAWAVGGRIGWLPFQAQQLLAYVSGGYTQTRFDAINFVLNANGAPTGISMPSNIYKGWFVGTGYEYGLGFLPGLFWKTEYRFAQFNNDNVLLLGAPVGNSYDVDKYIHTVRSEIVWRFNVGGSPVVARY